MSKKLLQVTFVIFTLFTFVSCNKGKVSSDVVYRDKDFSVSETRIGDTESVKWSELPIPDNRIQNSIPSLDVDGDQYPLPQPNKGEFPFSLTISVPVNDNSVNFFELKSQYLMGNGKAVLEKNGEIIWEGFMDGGNGFPVNSFWNYNGEILFGFTNYSNSLSGEVTDYIIHSEGEKAIVIPSAFSPFVIQNEIIYFQRVNDEVVLVRNGEIVGEPYDTVLQACCGYESIYGILHNEKVIDFFAVKGNNWYHVQAGYQQ